MTESVRVKTVSEGLKFLEERIAENESRGESTLIFAEDRLTLLVERAICGRLGGSFLSDVVTFSRYLGLKGERVLSKQGSVMKVGEIILRKREDLSCFNKDYSPRSAKAVYECIAQLSACNITPQALLNSPTGDRVLDSKIKDVAIIFDEYRNFLSNEGYSDENTMLSLLPSAVHEDKNMPFRNVILFAFGSFTVQAREGIRAMAERCRSVTGIFTSGEEEFYTNEAEKAFKNLCLDYGGAKCREVPDSFDGTKKVLLKSLFQAETFARESSDTDKIFIAECSDRSAEARFAASAIKKHILGGMRFKDISVFVPDVNAYYPEIEKQFSEYKIPCFADVKKPLSAHPISAFLVSLFRAVDERCSPSSASDVLGNIFFGESGEFLNYLDRFSRFRGGAKREIKSRDVVETAGFDYEKVCAQRDRFNALTDMIKPNATGGEYCAAVKKILEFIGKDEKLKELEDFFSDVAIKSYLSQIDGVMQKMLDEICAVADGGRFTAGEFCDILSDGFSAAEISLIPIKSDAVFIGDITSSKVSDSKVVVALGLTDEVPMKSDDVALISDRDIIRLKQQNIDVEPLISEVNLRARESVALNLLSFTDKLYLSYPISSDGKEKNRSEIISYISKAFTRGKRKLSGERDFSLFPYDSSEPVPARKQMYVERDAIKADYRHDRKKYSAIVGILGGDIPLEKKVGDRISSGGSLFFGADGKRYLSPTLIEDFSRCPYRNFLERGIGIKEKKEGIVEFNDSGTFIHGVLCGIGERIKRDGVTDYDDCMRQAEQIGREMMELSEYRALKDNASDAFFSERLISDGKRISGEMYRQLSSGDFKIKDLEYNCTSYRLGIRGKIDRVDVCDDKFRIIDYKTGNIDTGIPDYFMGMRLQLELYAAVAKEKYGGKEVAGLFYFPAKVSFAGVDDGESAFGLKGFADERFREEMSGELSKKDVKSIPSGKFGDFLGYSHKVFEYGKKLISEGYIRPNPVCDACGYCKYKGICSFYGEPRKNPFPGLKAADIIGINEKKGENGDE